MRRLSIVLALLLASATASALAPNDHVDNFRLFDHDGKSHELYYLSDAKAVVFMVQGNGCPIVRNALPRLKEIRDTFESQGVEFRMINANLQDNRASIAKEAEEFGIDIPILIDDTQLIGESLGLVRTGEVFVVDPRTWTVAYHGALDDRLTYENQKAEAKHHYLADALEQMVAGETVEVAHAESVGCLINFPETGKRAVAAHAQISYSETIAPMLQENCVTCHREGGIGPWAMTEYNMVRGFAPMIREVIRTKRMPPWHADPHHGTWANDRSLTAGQVQTLVHWVEAGAPRGDGPDPLAESTKVWPEWGMGEPDLIVEITPHSFPATGIVDYQYQRVANPLDHDVWVRAVEILPGDRSALHHVITMFGEEHPEAENPRRRFVTKGTLGGYVPGNSTEIFPEGTGTLLPAGSTFMFQMHYTTYGKAGTDNSRFGIYFYDEKPEHQLAGTVLMNTKIKIPANTKAHTESASQVLKRDVLLYSLLPHSHFRGTASDFIAIYPNGDEEILLSVPKYDFNWQTSYEFAEPKLLPAGTTLVHHTTWDNSAQNAANPDPSIEVTWGEQTFEEMLFGAVTWRYLDDNNDEPVNRLSRAGDD